MKKLLSLLLSLSFLFRVNNYNIFAKITVFRQRINGIPCFNFQNKCCIDLKRNGVFLNK